MEIMQFDSGIKKIEVQNAEGNQITVLQINVDDSSIVNRFMNLINNLEHVSDEFEKEAREKEEKYKDRPITEESKIDTEQVIDICNLNIRFLNRCAEEINAVFGKDTIKNVFKECYELNEDFVPDESALLRFIDGVIPEMNKLFKQKFERNKKRYSPSNKGKKT